MPQCLPQQVPALGSLRLWQKTELTGDPTHNEFGASGISITLLCWGDVGFAEVKKDSAAEVGEFLHARAAPFKTAIRLLRASARATVSLK
jgi:hypothetical protein